LLPNFFVDMTTLTPEARAMMLPIGINPTPGPSFGHGVGFLSLAATPDVGIGNPFLGGGGPRNIQLGVRVTF
ncbi:MAG: hypothetical protein ACREU7_09445, partial [Burkholderiales bacterium]